MENLKPTLTENTQFFFLEPWDVSLWLISSKIFLNDIDIKVVDLKSKASHPQKIWGRIGMEP